MRPEHPKELDADAARLRAAADEHRAQQAAAWKRFLESTPPNVPQKFTKLLAGKHHPRSASSPSSIPMPPLSLFCETDSGVRVFDAEPAYLFPRDHQTFEFVVYVCRNCRRQSKTIAIMIDPNDRVFEAMKLGEYPPYGSPIALRIAKLLGDDDLQLYRKGLRAEAAGLGIGAASYFRRIVDNQWKKLVGEIREAATALGVTNLKIFDDALAEISFSKATEMLKDAIPAKLLILGGENPLTLLYKPLSVQLHGLSDAECLQQAADIRIVLTALLENIADVLKSQNELRSAANRLSQIKS